MHNTIHMLYFNLNMNVINLIIIYFNNLLNINLIIFFIIIIFYFLLLQYFLNVNLIN